MELFIRQVLAVSARLYWISSSRLSSFVHHVVKDVTLDAQEKLFVLTTFSRFIRVMQSQRNVVNAAFG